MGCPRCSCSLIKKLFGKKAAPIDFGDDFKTKLKHIEALRKAIIKFIAIYENFLRKTTVDPHVKLANLLHDYAETTIEEEVAQRRIQSAAKELNQMGEIYNKFNKHAREEVVERLKNWCNGRDGGYLQLRKSMATLDETRSKLNEGMKQASITDLDEAGEHECTQKLRRQYDESLDKMQQGIEQFYNGLEDDPALSIYQLMTLVRNLGKQGAITNDPGRPSFSTE